MTTQQAIPKDDLSQSPPQNVADYLKWAPKLGVEFNKA